MLLDLLLYCLLVLMACCCTCFCKPAEAVAAWLLLLLVLLLSVAGTVGFDDGCPSGTDGAMHWCICLHQRCKFWHVFTAVAGVLAILLLMLLLLLLGGAAGAGGLPLPGPQVLTVHYCLTC